MSASSQPAVTQSPLSLSAVQCRQGLKVQIRYDTIEEFNVDLKAECDQLNLAHVARKRN